MIKYILRLLSEAFIGAMTVASFAGVFVNNFTKKNIWLIKILIIVGVFLLALLAWTIVSFGRGRRKISSFGRISINAMYGNILHVRKWFKKKRKPVVVIHVNSAFDVDVQDDLNTPNPIVSLSTLHGEWIKRIIDKKIMTLDGLKSSINDAIQQSNLKINKVLPNKTGNATNYELGSTIFIETNHCTYMLFALSEFDDKNHVVEKTKSLYCNLVSRLIDETSRCQGRDVYIPIMGIGLSMFGVSPADAFDEIKGTAMSKKTSLKSSINIVVPFKYARTVSIYD